MPTWAEDVNIAFNHAFGEDGCPLSRLPGGYSITPSGTVNCLNDMVSVVASNPEDIECFCMDEKSTVRPIDWSECSTHYVDQFDT